MEYIPEVEAGIAIMTDDILIQIMTDESVSIRDIIRRAYSGGWENGYEAKTDGASRSFHSGGDKR